LTLVKVVATDRSPAPARARPRVAPAGAPARVRRSAVAP